ncbi:MAG: ABC transporter ATP-binding protein [Deltaproteobacteria bacterium]|nr:ABC transporter ATP-binding protein [Deltaproteobacteria bacterium]
MSAPIVEVRNLTKKYGDVVAVDDVSFVIEEKEFLVLLGPSGCGKTTMLRMIAGLEVPTSGEIYLKNSLVFSSKKGVFIPARERDVGLVFQSYALWPHMTVFDNIAFGLRVKKKDRETISKSVAHVLGYMQLAGMEQRYPQEMSGGQQQRVALARMLVSEPHIFLMDEPLSNLDAKLRLEMRAEIKNLHLQTNATTVYVTHDQVEAQTMADRIAVINRGRVEQLDTPKNVYHQPRTLFVADFISSPPINQLLGRVQQSADTDAAGLQVKTAFSCWQTAYHGLKDGHQVVLAIRPENVALVSEHGLNTIEARVQTVLPSGPETVLKVAHEKELFNVLVMREVEVRLGETILVHLPVEHILLFDYNSGELLPSR